MPKLTIDGRQIEVEPGITVLQACEIAGIEVGPRKSGEGGAIFGVLLQNARLFLGSAGDVTLLTKQIPEVQMRRPKQWISRDRFAVQRHGAGRSRR